MKRSSFHRSIFMAIVILVPLYGNSTIFFQQLHIGTEERLLPGEGGVRTTNYSTIWPYRKRPYEWCYPLQQADKLKHPPGLLYVKIPKAASSTLAGINMRIAHRIGEQMLLKPSLLSSPFGSLLRSMKLISSEEEQQQVCSHTRTHGRDMLLLQLQLSQGKQSNNNNMHSSTRKPLLWSFVRDPAARAQSAFYHFQVSRKGVTPTLGHLISYCSSEEASANFQFRYLSTDENPQSFLNTCTTANNNENNHNNNNNNENVDDAKASCDKVIQDQILNQYDFVGVVERWAESLAVMILLWNLQHSDVIVLPSKVAGGFDDGRFQTAGNCKRIVAPSSSSSSSSPSSSLAQFEEEQEYLESFWNSTFRATNEYDYRLYQMTNDKLTKTIHALGRKRVQEVVKNIKALEAMAVEQCSSTAIFPCSSDGNWQYDKSKKNCYWLDSGCGYPCIDQLVASMKNA
ncbi:MAG: hypothetical protein SGBAC_006538 [Bacillariaceae sp.]